MQKRCFKCRKVKQLDQFYEHSHMADKHLNKCISCTKKDVKRRYYDPEARPRIKEYERKRSKDWKRKEKVRNYVRIQRQRYPGKNKARVKVGNYKRNGELKQAPCSVCGDESSQAHHPDYRRPLFVTWFCFKHHREAHGQLID